MFILDTPPPVHNKFHVNWFHLTSFRLNQCHMPLIRPPIWRKERNAGLGKYGAVNAGCQKYLSPEMQIRRGAKRWCYSYNNMFKPLQYHTL
jgi:hypothetical protein